MSRQRAALPALRSIKGNPGASPKYPKTNDYAVTSRVIKWPTQYTSPITLRGKADTTWRQSHNSFPNIVKMNNGNLVVTYVSSDMHSDFYITVNYGDSAATVQAALDGLQSFRGSGNVTVTKSGDVYTLEYIGVFANQDIEIARSPLFRNYLTGGTSPSVTWAKTQTGGGGQNTKSTITLTGSPTGGTFIIDFGGFPHNLYRKVSTDNGATWSSETLVVDEFNSTGGGAAYPTEKYGMYGHRVRKYPDDTLILIYYTHPVDRPEISEVFYRTSTDAGVTWTARTKVTSVYGLDYMAAHHLTIEGSRCWMTVMGLDSGYYDENDPDYNWYSKLLYTDDKGATWNLQGTIATKAQTGGHANAETSITRLTDGRLYAMSRVEGAVLTRWAAWSSDDGVTWTGHTQVMTNVRNISITAYAPDGQLMTVYGVPATKLAFSLDDGLTWQGHYQLPIIDANLASYNGADWVTLGAKGADGNMGLVWANERAVAPTQTEAEVYYMTLTAMQLSIGISQQRGIARLSTPITKTQSGKASIVGVTQQTQSGVARISSQSTQTQSGKARITVSTNRTQSGTSRITASLNQTQQGKSRITASTSKTQTGIARIGVANNTQTQSGKARIATSSDQTQSGISRITKITARTQSGVARISGGTTSITSLFPGIIYDYLLDDLRTTTVKTVTPPLTASDTGKKGQVAIDDSYIYICVATNTWLRAALSTW